jgi:hypothetical protein
MHFYFFLSSSLCFFSIMNIHISFFFSPFQSPFSITQTLTLTAEVEMTSSSALSSLSALSAGNGNKKVVNFDSSAGDVSPRQNRSVSHPSRPKALSEFQLHVPDEEEGLGTGGTGGKTAAEPNRRKAFSECNADEYEDKDGVVRTSRVDAKTSSSEVSGATRSSRLPNKNYYQDVAEHNDHVSIDVADPLGTPPPIGMRGIPRGISGQDINPLNLFGEGSEEDSDASSPRPNSFAGSPPRKPRSKSDMSEPDSNKDTIPFPHL